MKKLLLIALIAVGFSSYAQSESENGVREKGSWMLEINTGFGEASSSNTAFSFRSVDGNTAWSIGGEAGYFIADDFALKFGLGYSSIDIDGFDSESSFNWKFGGKYYISEKYPVGLDLNGSSSDGYSPLYLGVQAGYAWHIASNVSIEPGLRYGFGLNEDAGDGDFNHFGINIGFNIFL